MPTAAKNSEEIAADMPMRVMGSGVGTMTAVKAKHRKITQRQALSMLLPRMRPRKFSSTSTTGMTKAMPKASIVFTSSAR